ncbi:MAG: histidine kinase [Bacteroidota bacterium]
MSDSLIKSEFKPGFWFFQISGWIGFGITDALISEYDYITRSQRDFMIWLVSLLLGFVLSLGLRVYYRYFLKRKSSILTAALLIISGSVVAALLWQYAGDFIRRPLYGGEYISSYEPGYLVQRIYTLVWPFFVWSILYFGIKFWINMVDEKIRASRADAESRQAQLQLLRYQINPHFLFNTLNSIRALIRRETEAAEMMITEFSEFLRYTLQHNNKTYIPLDEEIEIVKKYLLLEKIRFENRLIYSFENSADSLKIPVLCFLIQPFVENAIKHGLKNSPSGIALAVRSCINDQALYLEIENTGRWIHETDESGTGIRNVAERLANAYPGNHTFDIEKGDKMVRVSITINLEK